MDQPRTKYGGGQLSREVIRGNSFTMEHGVSSSLYASRRSKSPNVGIRLVARGSLWCDGGRFLSPHRDSLNGTSQSALLGVRLVSDAKG